MMQQGDYYDYCKLSASQYLEYTLETWPPRPKLMKKIKEVKEGPHGRSHPFKTSSLLLSN